MARAKRAVSGVLLLDKPRGITSQGAVTRVKRLFGAAKAGHTGTLDPMAQGLLPICLGEATKFSHLLLDADKGYRARITLGVTTTTGDVEGEIIRTAKVLVDRGSLESVLGRFTGDILQTPPMYSAVKHEGRRLYAIARSGQTVARVPRSVTIAALDIVSLSGSELTIDVLCSKGTYVRVLAEDIGSALGCGASLDGLLRTRVGAFRLENALSLEALEGIACGARDECLLAVDALVACLPRVDLDMAAARWLSTGRPVKPPDTHSAADLVRIYGPGGRFLGVGRIGDGGDVVPRRLMAAPSDGV